MRPDPFVHLHVASGYSMQYGANHPADLVERAAEHGMRALALTDRDGLYGAVKFALACRAADVRPLFGVDLAVTPSVDTTVPPPLAPVVGGAHSVMHAQADAVAQLAVAHVAGRITDRGVGSLKRVRDTTTSSDLARLGPKDAWLVLKSRFIELAGMAKGDDEELERAKSAHAVAMADGAGIPVDPSDRAEVVDDVAPEVRDRR